MADITIVKRQHYSGLDADKASVTGAVGETYGATDSGKLYYWNVSLSAWKTGLGYEFVDRLANAPDKQVGDFTTNGAWQVNALDLSGIVPAGAVAVKIAIKITDDAADSYFQIRHSAGQSESFIQGKVPVAHQGHRQVEDVSIESDRLLDYKGSNLAFQAIDVTVLGWYI